MARYHLTPDGPKVCSAKFRCQYKDAETGTEPKHYPNKAAAATAYEGVMEAGGNVMQGTSSKTNPNSLAEKLKTEEPVDIDGKLAEFYYAAARLESERTSVLVRIEKSRKHLKKSIEDALAGGYRDYYSEQHEKSIKKLEAEVLEIDEAIEKSEDEQAPYENEFNRRGGWTRAFLVNNVNGHVHKSMDCGTCFPSTSYAWMTQYSGKDEGEIVSAAGERACTMCYPSAPVSDLRKPTQMFTPDEIEKKKAREERARKSEEKAEQVKIGGIFAEDGGELILPRNHYRTGTPAQGEVVKTSKKAQTVAVDRMVSIRITEQDKADYEAKGDFSGINEEYLAERKNDLEILVKALSRKHGFEEDYTRGILQAKADQKYNAQMRKWGLEPRERQ